MEITESKNYSEPEKHVGDREDAEKGVKDLDLTSNVPPATGGGGSDVFVPGSTVCDSSNIEYVPAEYFRGVPTAHLVQSGKMFLYQIRMGSTMLIKWPICLLYPSIFYLAFYANTPTNWISKMLKFPLLPSLTGEILTTIANIT